MKPTSTNKWALINLLTLALLAPSWVVAQPAVGRLVVFGTSLSDPGNAYALTGQASMPPYATLDMFLVPDAPYSTGGHHFSNGATWIEQLALLPGIAGKALPAFQGSNTNASNYAVGGARARNNGINVNLSDQVNAYMHDSGGAASPDALYVIEFGGNDVRDALTAFTVGADGGAIITIALSAMDDNIRTLYAAGARKFLVLNAPDLRLVPAIRILDSLFPGAGHVAEYFSLLFNEGLDTLLASEAGLPGIQFTKLDLYQKLNELSDSPAAFGLREVTIACVTPNLPPFKCHTPDDFLFWDGIHPTKVVHAILAKEAASLLTH